MPGQHTDGTTAGSSDGTHAQEPSAPGTARRSRRSRETTSRRWRVAGGLFGAALAVRGLRRRGVAGLATALAGGLLAARAARGRSRRAGPSDEGTTGRRDERGPSADPLTVTRSVTVRGSPEELSERLRDSETLDRVAGDAVTVTAAGGDRHRWTVDGPLGRRLSWETRVTEERSGERLRWETVGGGTVDVDGTVDLRPASGDRGTHLTLRLRVDPPGGRAGAAALERLGVVPDALAGRALDRFKSLVEVGTVPTLDRNPSARGRGDLL